MEGERRLQGPSCRGIAEAGAVSFGNQVGDGAERSARQLNSVGMCALGVNNALESLGVEAPCVISLAKREEEVFMPGRSEPLRLSRDSYSLRLLEYVRDEAHRFAQHYHHLLRHKRFTGDRPKRHPGKGKNPPGEAN